MMKESKIIILLLPIIFLLNNGCSYQRINLPGQETFFLENINVEGESRPAFLIKRKINRFSDPSSQNRLKIDISLDKKRVIQEKNIQNKVTKYKISLITKLKVTNLSKGNTMNRVYNNHQIYNVDSKKYSSTINNAKEAESSLINLTVDQILEGLRFYLN